MAMFAGEEVMFQKQIRDGNGRAKGCVLDPTDRVCSGYCGVSHAKRLRRDDAVGGRSGLTVEKMALKQPTPWWGESSGDKMGCGTTYVQHVRACTYHM